MKLEHVVVEGFGPFRNPVGVTLQPSITVLHAPNETGKSSWVEAVRWGLWEPAVVSARQLERWRPWGTAVHPTVTVTFTARGRRWRVTKRFGERRAATAELAEDRAGRWLPVADDPETVQQQLFAMLTGEDAPDRTGRRSGTAQRERQGMAAVLWILQGTAPLDAAQLTLRGAPERQLAAATGAALLTAQDHRIAERARAAAEEWLTAGRQEERGLLKAAHQTWETAKQQAAEARQRLRSWEALQETVLAREAEWRAAERRWQDAAATADAARAAWDQARQAAAGWEAAEQAARQAEEAWRQWEALLQQVDRAHQAWRTAAAAAEAAQRLEWQHAHTVTALRAELHTHREALEQAQRTLETAAATAHAARLREEAARVHAAWREVSRRLAEGQALADRLTQLTAERAAHPVPDRAAVAALQAEERAIREEQAALAGWPLRWTVTPATAWTGTLWVDGQAEPVAWAAGVAVAREAWETVRLELPGVGTWEVSRGVPAEVQRRREAAAARAQQLAARLAAWDVPTVEALLQRVQEDETRAARIEELRRQLAQWWPDGSEALRLQQAAYAARRAELWQQFPDIADDPDAWTEPRAAAARQAGERAETTARQHVTELTHAVEAAQAALGEAEAAWAQARADYAAAKQTATAARDHWETLQAQAGASEAERAERTRMLQADRDTAHQRWTAVQAQAEAEAAARRRWEEADGLRAELEGQVDAAREQWAIARSQVQTDAETGLYAAWVAAEEAADRAQAAYEALRREAEARRYVVEVLEQIRADWQTALVAPVAARVVPWWKEVSGGRWEAVEWGDGLVPATVRPTAAPPVAAEVLSGGAQEQLGLLIRLAVAEVLAEADPTEGQVLLWDEPLPYTDATRRWRLMRLLATPRPGLQVIVLAHDAGDWVGLPPPAVVALKPPAP